jgi:hypothetical protein
MNKNFFKVAAELFGEEVLVCGGLLLFSSIQGHGLNNSLSLHVADFLLILLRLRVSRRAYSFGFLHVALGSAHLSNDLLRFRIQSGAETELRLLLANFSRQLVNHILFAIRVVQVHEGTLLFYTCFIFFSVESSLFGGKKGLGLIETRVNCALNTSCRSIIASTLLVYDFLTFLANLGPVRRKRIYLVLHHFLIVLGYMDLLLFEESLKALSSSIVLMLELLAHDDLVLYQFPLKFHKLIASLLVMTLL